jgi:hypothetical protein
LTTLRLLSIAWGGILVFYPELPSIGLTRGDVAINMVIFTGLALLAAHLKEPKA